MLQSSLQISFRRVADNGIEWEVIKRYKPTLSNIRHLIVVIQRT